MVVGHTAAEDRAVSVDHTLVAAQILFGAPRVGLSLGAAAVAYLAQC